MSSKYKFHNPDGLYSVSTAAEKMKHYLPMKMKNLAKFICITLLLFFNISTYSQIITEELEVAPDVSTKLQFEGQDKLEVISNGVRINGTIEAGNVRSDVATIQAVSISHLSPYLEIENSTPLHLSEGQTVGELRFRQNDPSSGGTGLAGSIRIISRNRPDGHGYYGNVARMGLFVGNNSGGLGSLIETLTVSQPGRVGIRNTNPSYTLHVGGSSYSSGGWSGSDLRFKKNILPLVNSLSTVMALRGVSFDWRNDEFQNQSFPEKREIGFIAQEVEKYLPEVVNTDQEGYKAISYEKVTALLVEALKDLKEEKDKEVAALKERIASLEANCNP